MYRVECRDTCVLAPTGAGGGGGTSVPAGWHSVTTMPWVWLFAGLVVCALFASGVSFFTTDSRHRLWGLSAACAYALVALAVPAWRARVTVGVHVAVVLVIFGAILVPLVSLVATWHR